MNYQPLTLYYLNQMGITPWVHKDQIISYIDKQDVPDSDYKLIICSPVNQSPKAHILLKKIMDFIKRANIKLQLFECESKPASNDLKQLHTQLQRSKPLAILSLGVDLSHFLKEFHLNCPIFSNASPESLLNNLAAKKKIFEDLLQIQSTHSTYSS